MKGRAPGSGGMLDRVRDFLLSRIPDDRERDAIAQDLEEFRRHRARSRGALRAGLAYWWELLRYVWAFRRLRASADGPGPYRSREEGWSGSSLLLESVIQDLVHAWRSFVRSPGILLASIPTIALAVGATTAIFSVLDGLVLRPLRVPEPERLVSLHHLMINAANYSEFSYPDFVELREEGTALRDLAAFSSIEVSVGEGLEARTIAGLIVSGNYFDVLGRAPVAGRWFTSAEDRIPDAHPVAVISEGYWERHFGRDPNTIGGGVTIQGRQFRVVGVAPADLPSVDLESDPDLWVPLMMHPTVLQDFEMGGTPLFGNRGTHWLALAGRLADGRDLVAAEAELQAIARRQGEEHPETNGGWTIRLARAGDQRSGPPSARRLVSAAGLLAGVVGMVLVLACANVANLLLARASARDGEMAVRVALGAGRRRLLRQNLTEALALSVVGGTLGVLVAAWLLHFLPRSGILGGLPGLDLHLDRRILAFSMGLSILTGVVFGIVPALQASSARMGCGGRRNAVEHRDAGTRLRRLLVSLQVALSLVLLIGAALTLRTLVNLRNVPLGFDPTDLYVASIDFQAESEEGETSRLEPVRRSVSEVPGVSSAAFARISPFSGARMANDVFWESATSGGDLSRGNVDLNIVGVDYFTVMEIPILRGRRFTEDDRAGAVSVVLVNQALATRFWPGKDPVGEALWTWNPNGPDRRLEVIGVAGNGRYYRSWLDADRPFAFLPLAQNEVTSAELLIRGSETTVLAPRAVREAVIEALPGAGPPRVERLIDRRAGALALQRATAHLLTLLGLFAVVVAGIGIYGVVAFMIARRTHEIGVRVALGARPPDVRRFMMLESLRPLLAGATIGLLAALGLSRFIAGSLFGIGARDPATFATVAIGLLGIGMIASYVPIRRAMRISAMDAMRE